ncbi:envelope glycoprotein, partial [Schistosoma japonicum]
NWSERIDETLEALRAAVLRINSTRVDLSLTEGLSLPPDFREWVGVGLFGVATCCGLVFMLWLVCKLRTQQTNDKVVIAQALAAIEQGASPEICCPCLRPKWHLELSLLIQHPTGVCDTMHWDVIRDQCSLITKPHQ